MTNDNDGTEAAAGSTAADQTAQFMTTLSTSIVLQNALQAIPEFDGRNLPLKDFLQDIQNGALYISAGQMPNYIRAIVSKLRGPARDSTYGRTFGSIDDLIKHLKTRFAPGKDYSYYNNKITLE